MRILALDVGDRRIGVALSDPLGMLASPLTTIERSGAADIDAAVNAIASVAERHSACEIIVGIPYLMSGRIGAQARITLEFAAALDACTPMPITQVDERLSSAQAARMLAQSGDASARGRRDKGSVDAAAAAVMLQAYLDARA